MTKSLKKYLYLFPLLRKTALNPQQTGPHMHLVLSIQIMLCLLELVMEAHQLLAMLLRLLPISFQTLEWTMASLRKRAWDHQKFKFRKLTKQERSSQMQNQFRLHNSLGTRTNLAIQKLKLPCRSSRTSRDNTLCNSVKGLPEFKCYAASHVISTHPD